MKYTSDSLHWIVIHLIRYSGLLKILENIPLAPFTTFGIGGPARWFIKAESESAIAEAVAWAEDRGAALFILGGGSNLLISDTGFDGLVVHIGLRGVATTGESGHKIYQAAAGEDWDSFVERTVSDNCAGLECLAGIPGTVGGTPVQNVGAYGQEVSTSIAGVRAFDLTQHTFVELSASECDFSYRHSRFNTNDRGRFIVTRVDYRLTPDGAPQLTYADLKSHFENQPQPTLSEVASAVRSVRQSKGMLLVDGDPDCRSAGSFFKNPTVSQQLADRVRQVPAAASVPLRVFPAADGLVKIPAAWLIEQAGFPKGFALGAAGISSRHTLALINLGGATSADILTLADQIKAAVQYRFGITLEMEPVLLGD